MKFTYSIFAVFLNIIFSISAVRADGIYNPDTLWKKTEFKVCFADKFKQITKKNIARPALEDGVKLTHQEFIPFSAKEIKAIQNAVTISYEQIGFKFKGWSNCSALSDPDLVIYKTNLNIEELSTGALGDPSLNTRHKGKSINTLQINTGYLDSNNAIYGNIEKEVEAFSGPIKDEVKTLMREHLFALSIVHEFGHFLGLHHENLRDDGELVLSKTLPFSESLSLQTQQLTFKLYSITNSDYAEFHMQNQGAFDILSVMNYARISITKFAYHEKLMYDMGLQKRNCNPEYFQLLLPIEGQPLRTALSEGDRKTLRKMYFGEDDSTNSEITESLVQWLESIKRYP